MREFFVTLVMALACVGAGAAPPAAVVPAGVSLRLYSDLLDEEREILVSLPPSHGAAGLRYPVLFVLDGEEHFRHAAATSAFLAGIGRIPEILVVGVPNTARLRDLSPPTDLPEEAALGTGGDVFLDFLERELAPWLEANYQAAPLRILFGHSRGGLINLQALLTRPGAFRGHIAASPYFGWSEERMIRRAADELPRIGGRHFLFMSTGDNEPEIRASVEKMAEVFARKAPEGLAWNHVHLPGEDHGSTPLPTIYQGLGKFFVDWPPNAAVAAGDVEAFEAHFAALSREFGYAVEPSAIAYWELQGTLLEKQSAAGAIPVFERAAERYPGNRYLFENLAAAYRQAGRSEDAKRASTRAYELARATASAEERKELREAR